MVFFPVSKGSLLCLYLLDQRFQNVDKLKLSMVLGH